MREVHVERPRFQVSEEPDVSQYRAISVLAVVSLILGLLSPTAMFSPLLWVLPPIALVVSVLALRRIAFFAPALIGRKAALTGLALSVALSIAAPVHWLSYRWVMRNEARQFGPLYFQYLAKQEPHKAFQLTEPPEARQPLDENLWKYYSTHPETYEEFEGYLKRPVVRTLLALGDRAIVRYYDTEWQYQDGREDVVYQTYAVTIDNDGEQQTFFIGLRLNRSPVKDTGHTFWRASAEDRDILPNALGGQNVH